MSIKTQAKIKLGMTAFIVLTLAVGGTATLPSAEASNRHSSNAAYQTYVIHTYGGASLLPSVRQTLASYGGSASFYQDKLVLRTTPTGYQAVQNLLGQIDGVPQSLRVSVRVGQTSDQTGTIRQGQIVITNNSIGGYGRYGSNQRQTQSNNVYQVQTLSGSSAQIGTGTLVSLAQPYITTAYNRHGQPLYRITVLGQVLANANQGIAVTPRLLPNNQVQIDLNQSHDTLSGNARYPINTQGLSTTLNIARGQWVTVGSVSQSSINNTAGYGYQQSNQTTQMPIQIRVD